MGGSEHPIVPGRYLAFDREGGEDDEQEDGDNEEERPSGFVQSVLIAPRGYDSEVAGRVQSCLFDPDGRESRLELQEYDHGVWHGFVPGMRPGDRYGFRVYGPYEPTRGLRCNPAKLLLDPYAKVEGNAT